jgi:hypothetical protein
MNQTEIKEFLLFCESDIKGFKMQDCDESKHAYVNDEMVGGWAGDSREFFFEQNDTSARILNMMDAAKRFDSGSSPGM